MERIVVLDFGGQYAHLICNRVRRLGVFAEIMPAETNADNLRDPQIKGLILSGGPNSVYEKDAPQCDPGIFDLNIPVLGICYGHHLMSYVLQGKVTPGTVKEYGAATLHIKHPVGIFAGFTEESTPIWMSHGDEITQLPNGFEILGSTDDCKTAAIGNPERNLFGTQFHVEVVHTARGRDMLDNFLKLCNVSRNWNIDQFLKDEIEKVKKLVGDRNVFMLVSGGVDSTVAFTLLERALSADRVYGLFVDIGFMRLNEREEVEAALQKLNFQLHVQDASKDFQNALKDVTDPEQKRKIIGAEFLKVHARVAKELKLNPDEWMFGQGTIYPDTIESGGTVHADRIKTHHNQIPEIKALAEKGLVIEPIHELYKDEVREVGTKLGLSEELVWRHPFPGPGLAIRCLCTKKPEPIEDEKEVTQLIKNFLEPHSLHGKILPIKSVGVQGDARTYRHPLVLFGDFPGFEKLSEISTDLTNQFATINRVLWACHPGVIDSVELRPGTLTSDRINYLQNVDHAVTEFLKEAGLMKQMWQFPVVLLPISANNEKSESIVLRPVCSEEAMTANFYQMPYKFLLDLIEKIMIQIKSPPSAIFYDITNKPPGTIEWE